MGHHGVKLKRNCFCLREMPWTRVDLLLSRRQTEFLGFSLGFSPPMVVSGITGAVGKPHSEDSSISLGYRYFILSVYTRKPSIKQLSQTHSFICAPPSPKLEGFSHQILGYHDVKSASKNRARLRQICSFGWLRGSWALGRHWPGLVYSHASKASKCSPHPAALDRRNQGAFGVDGHPNALKISQPQPSTLTTLYNSSPTL